MPGARWVTVDATIGECFREWQEPTRSTHPWFEIVADIKTSGGEVKRVTSRRRLNTLTHHWRAPDPGDVVPALWNPVQGELRLALGRDPRYDQRVIKALGRTRSAPPGPPSGAGGPG